MLHWAIDNLVDPKRDLVIVTHVRNVAYVPGGYGMVGEGKFIFELLIMFRLCSFSFDF